MFYTPRRYPVTPPPNTTGKKRGAPYRSLPFSFSFSSGRQDRTGYPFYIILNRAPSRLFSYSSSPSRCFSNIRRKRGGGGARRKGGTDFASSRFRGPYCPRYRGHPIPGTPLKTWRQYQPTDETSTRNGAKPADSGPFTLPGNFRTSAGIIDSLPPSPHPPLPPPLSSPVDRARVRSVRLINLISLFPLPLPRKRGCREDLRKVG